MTSLIYLVYFPLIEMPSNSKHLYINCWLRFLAFQLLFHFRPIGAESVNSFGLPFEKGLRFVWCFLIHYAFNSSWMWQLFHVITLYQLLTQTANQRLVNNKPFTSSGRRVTPRTRPLMRFYAFNVIFGFLLSTWQTICTGPESMFDSSSANGGVPNSRHVSPTFTSTSAIGSPLLLAWAFPAVGLIVHFTITILTSAILRNETKENNTKQASLYFDRNNSLNCSNLTPSRPEPLNACLLKPDLLTNITDLYWTYGKQLQLLSAQLLLTLLIVAAVVGSESTFLLNATNQSAINQTIARTRYSTTSDVQPVPPAHLLYEHLLSQSELSAEQMQNLQNWLMQLQNSQSNSAHKKSQFGGPQHLPLHVQRTEPHAQLRTTPFNVNRLTLTTNEAAQQESILDSNVAFHQFTVDLLRRYSIHLTSLFFSLFVFVQFVLLREDVRVAIASGCCGACLGTIALCNCTGWLAGCTRTAPDDSLQRAKVKAMREQLRKAAAESGEPVQRPLLDSRRVELSAMDSGQFSSQPSCTITQSLSSCSGNGLSGSTRGGTLMRNVSELNGNEILNRSNALDSFGHSKLPIVDLQSNKPHVYYEAVAPNVIANNDEYNFWSLMRNHHHHPNSSIVQTANSNSRVQLLGTFEHSQASQLNSMMTAQLLNKSNQGQTQRAFDDVRNLKFFFLCSLYFIS